MNTSIENKDYFNDLNKIKETIRQNQNKAMVVVNSAMIMTYYEIGTIINSRKTWGSKYIQKLSDDLKEYGKGYSYENLYRMSKFALEFTYKEIMSQPVTQIPWSTLMTVIFTKSSSHEEMIWYINETHSHGWSRSMVMNQMTMKAYERSLIEPSVTDIVKSDDLTNELFKDTYVIEFTDREHVKDEKDLKKQMIDHIIEFLQELGEGFSFVGKEYKIKVPSEEKDSEEETFYIDLLMYNIRIHAYVVIEVKIGKFHPADLGQLSFYVNAVNDLERTEGDNDTIGLLLCKEANSYVARTSLIGNQLKLGISKYKFMDEIPGYLERKLKETE